MKQGGMGASTHECFCATELFPPAICEEISRNSLSWRLN
jgi:hypothetical protein